jgi:SHS2 domain-containing protein
MMGNELKPGKRKFYRLLEHTGDLRIRVWGKNLPDLFDHAGWALFNLMTWMSRVKPVIWRELKVEAPDREALLVAWLGELLYLYETEKMLFARFEFSHLSDTALIAQAAGEPYQPGRHPLRLQIKAVTYHQIRVWFERGLYKAQITFDL